MNEENIAFSGELQLAGWGQTHSGGVKVTFWLNSEEDLACFKHMTVRKGNTAGQRFMAVLVELNDDDTPVAQNRGPARALFLSAIGLCKNDAFQRFCEGYEANVSGVSREEHASRTIKKFCHVESRKNLDESIGAQQLFRRLMHIYSEWQRDNA